MALLRLPFPFPFACLCPQHPSTLSLFFLFFRRFHIHYLHTVMFQWSSSNVPKQLQSSFCDFARYICHSDGSSYVFLLDLVLSATSISTSSFNLHIISSSRYWLLSITGHRLPNYSFKHLHFHGHPCIAWHFSAFFLSNLSSLFHCGSQLFERGNTQ